MPLVFYMLNMTRGAVGLVFGNEYSIGSQLDAAVVTVAAGGAGSFAVDRIRTLVAARTGQLAFRISRQADGAHALDMKRMKLLAAPILVSVARQACYGNLLQCPLAVVQSFPIPLSIHHRVAKRPSMGRTDLATVVRILVRIIVAFSTRQQRSLSRFELRSAVLGMTGNTADARSRVGLNDSRNKSFRVVTLRTVRLHAPGEGMTVRTGVGIGPNRYRREYAEF